MKTSPSLSKKIAVLLLLGFLGTTLTAQVGINTTTPDANALLDITSTPANTGGLLLPRVALTAINSALPLTAHVAGMTVYNNATAGTFPNNVTPGYYYNDGTVWVRIAAANNWGLAGNGGTTPLSNFIGTTDDVALRFRTFSTDAFEISNGDATNRGKMRALTNGTAALPVYSFGTTVGTGIGTGMFQQASNVLGFSTGGTERFSVPNSGQVHAMADGSSAFPFYSWNIDPDTGIYRIGNNQLGLSTNGTERIRISGTGNVRIGAGSNASERLEIAGNLRLNGAFMPGNQAGTTGQILVSAGTNTAPTWGANLTNVSDITRYIVTGPDLNLDTIYSLTVAIPGVTTQSTGIISITGNWAADIFNDITIHNIEMRTGEVRFAVSNNTLDTIYPAMQFNLTIIR